MCTMLGLASSISGADELWSHVRDVAQLDDVRGFTAEFADVDTRRVLRLEAAPPRQSYAWAAVPVPDQGWNLERVASIQATVRNCSPKPTETMLWVVGSNGWGAVGDVATLKADETRTFRCDLRQTYPDGTPRIDPNQVSEIRFMVRGPKADTALDVSRLVADGRAPRWVRPAGRLDVPPMTEDLPAAGRRVRYQLPGDAGTSIYCVLYLPLDWQKGKSCPVVAEYPGNIFLNARCYSTGRPEQCVMGYGMTEGKGTIWVSLPFINRAAGDIAESGFGANDGEDTTSYAIDLIEDICRNWGGDRDNLVLSGFSRGAIACGYIGLRNERIGAFWKGFSACQHYDGSAWHQSNMKDAVQRAERFTGRAIFQTDNSQKKYQPVVDATTPSVAWTWANSGLRFHATAMFLDERPSTRQLRQWFRDLVTQP
ncbi:MAG: hypothetical protein HN742_13110 [Lentisphaerae bacterium]|jgi:hypothetical protein|nr:hypothetical protein [Lentisphaerota bacterium]MBT5607871.1 hypothetical protein [Lentisphaerota bacterium]MBT7058262.1 hypothetical protein [Lentisphaerota bacterium]MBT7842810.1 hypothetical protein [Lentisphaerota bacterium]